MPDTSDTSRAVLAWDGPLSPPRRNGEMVFDALWQSRLFGMTMTLHESGAFAWDEFRDRLIEAIRVGEQGSRSRGVEYRYWDCWLAAFERLLAEKGLCTPDELEARATAFAARPPGHDHER